jgi:ELWxxDGT repeat protein
MLKDINPGPDGSRLGPLVAVGGTLFFSADYSLRKSDGAEAGTVLAHDFHPVVKKMRLRRSGDFLVLGRNVKHEDEGASPKMAKRLEAMLA